MDKKVDLDRLVGSVRDAHRIGFNIHANVIIGHPEERWSDLAASAAILVRLAWAGCDTASAIMFSAYPGSVDFDRLLDQGRVRVDEAMIYSALTRGAAGHAQFNPRFGRQLRVIQLALMAGFHGLTLVRRPQRVMGLWRAYSRGEERSVLDKLIRVRRFGHSTVRAPRPANVTR